MRAHTFSAGSDNSLYYRELFNFSGVERLNQIFNNLDPWELADFTQKDVSEYGNIRFCLKKRKET